MMPASGWAAGRVWWLLSNLRHRLLVKAVECDAFVWKLWKPGFLWM